MKAVILAGGLGTRISEETHLKPKPMIEIGGKPIIWHIMKIYSYYGINEFIVCLGYKGYMIKEYFANYFLHMSDVTFDMLNNTMQVHQKNAEDWKVTLVDTGDHTMTGGRLKRVRDYIGDETFCFTYGDGLSDVNVGELLAYHHEQGKMATLTAVQPAGRFGAIYLEDDNNVGRFQEKPQGDNAWINGGFFVLEPGVFELIHNDSTSWEAEPLEQLTRLKELVAYKHSGFWQPMDTMRDKNKLEELWLSNKAPWKLW
ncbi:glucose-1-phosphate cytidylyltransferase [Paenibacillus sambharensis]|uniref:Glucose-1-phosphate cytidylyltransferase n=1 Tax=Paenibacillus sambharensis TaxID=1803190 RepID=A0A2W1LFM8_9BACL|nr:glucose-1-phosphate cytidylyltransferase [Paenibacillus sambharensis]PZD97846.1 glucose-1-phosphate cytidylyltransferase [Paenibacillus sambharensis]